MSEADKLNNPSTSRAVKRTGHTCCHLEHTELTDSLYFPAGGVTPIDGSLRVAFWGQYCLMY